MKHSHSHWHPHTHAHPHDHNHTGAETHLYSHPHAHPHAANPGVVSEDDELMIKALVSGFEAAEDKTSFLRMAKVPFEIPSATGGRSLKLVDVEVRQGYQIGTASPGFASDELVYHPFPGNLVRQRTDMNFVYVSLAERRDIGFAEMVKLTG